MPPVYAFGTIMPRQVPDPDDKPQAPHILLAMFGRGMLRHLYTRIYFGGEKANDADPVLALVPVDRRATLVATPRARRRRGVSSRPPPAGRQRDGVFRYLIEVKASFVIAVCLSTT
jgi:protocatechuate 3,4-dioxygenase beta subunit